MKWHMGYVPMMIYMSNVSHVLLRENQTLKLKKTQAYYTQVQMQMAITGRKWCDFFAYSKLSHVIDCIYYDESFCTPLFATCEIFCLILCNSLSLQLLVIFL